MQFALRLHPDCRCDAVTSIDVQAERTDPASLMLNYRVTGDIGALLLPSIPSPERADGLWQHTCFEAFVRAGGGGYCEYNFSPSTQWAAYVFDEYRQGLKNADTSPPAIAIQVGERELELRATIAIPSKADAPWRLALSAVIEEESGRKSYWALAHPPGKPDFHHPDCFVAELARPSPS
jgi:hypothetical protein